MASTPADALVDAPDDDFPLCVRPARHGCRSRSSTPHRHRDRSPIRPDVEARCFITGHSRNNQPANKRRPAPANFDVTRNHPSAPASPPGSWSLEGVRRRESHCSVSRTRRCAAREFSGQGHDLPVHRPVPGRHHDQHQSRDTVLPGHHEGDFNLACPNSRVRVPASPSGTRASGSDLMAGGLRNTSPPNTSATGHRLLPNQRAGRQSLLPPRARVLYRAWASWSTVRFWGLGGGCGLGELVGVNAGVDGVEH